MQADPDDVEALTDLGTVLLREGRREAARTVYERAAALGPGRALAHANLGTVLLALTRWSEAADAFRAALALAPESAEGHQGLSYALSRLGRDAEAAEHRRRGFAGRAVTTAPYRGDGPAPHVLRLVSAAGGTIYTDEILDDRLVRVTTVVADAYADEPLPPTDLVFNAIADADRCAPELRRMAALVAGLDRPVVNPPERVLATGRVANAARIAAVGDVAAPRAAAVPRALLLRADGAAALAARGFRFPLLLRAPGYHTGEHFVRVDAPAALSAAAAALPGDETLVLSFADLRDGDGAVRKYRMMAIGGLLYPLHLAIARDWKVHYFTAEMADVPAYRAEEARFLTDPRGVLGGRAYAALERVAALLGLDYAGIDFGLDADRTPVVFEANATMIVLDPGPEPLWDYRRPHVARVREAARELLRKAGEWRAR